ADIRRKSDPFTILKCAFLAVHIDSDRRTISTFDTEDFDALEVTSMISSRFHSRFFQLIRDIGSSEAQSLRESGTSLQFIRCQIGQPGSEGLRSDGELLRTRDGGEANQEGQDSSVFQGNLQA